MDSPPPAPSSHTLPSRYYLDPDILEREKTAILYRHWHYAGHINQFTNSGDISAHQYSRVLR
ncbi:MAG TPA: hypothetical protein QGF27_12360 [Arenicellales bacterium]|nr:hypothetical protein [Arenicellales bacterium]MDP7219806.1 hypothetical protein [Arenicellales bacterium]HJP10815.1 hypothetical protein [Arenicellales bacterium]